MSLSVITIKDKFEKMQINPEKSIFAQTQQAMIF